MQIMTFSFYNKIYVALVLVTFVLSTTACKKRNTSNNHSASAISAATKFSDSDVVDLLNYLQAGDKEHEQARIEINQIYEAHKKSEEPEDGQVYRSYEEMENVIKIYDEYNDKSLPYYKIPLPELVSIRAYTTGAYRELNAVLRNQDPRGVPQYAGIIKSAASGLNKFPPHVGIVTRGVDIDINFFMKYQPGNRIVEKQFLSTTVGNSDQSYYCGRVKFVIASRSGRNIAWLSEYYQDGEDEVLFLPGSEFEVISRKVEPTPHGSDPSCPSERTVIQMNEIAPLQ